MWKGGTKESAADTPYAGVWGKVYLLSEDRVQLIHSSDDIEPVILERNVQCTPFCF